MFNPTREQVRQFFCQAWRKYRERAILEGAEVTAADLILHHPEYHALLEDPASALEQEFTPEIGQMNPFLHLSLHLAVAEQVSIDQPPGIRAAYQALRARFDVHEAEHAILECLGETIWRAQRHGVAMDGAAYLECVRRVAGL
ncbi:MAG: DUF1841 family protein [Candidatus Accumulibacter sp.]|mgnify:CR=1 FL=1|uniref:DUF1841 family protein n=1 Tax=Accumulibacter sp. TaxID=2053492 RepID=UPI001A59C021|nr:DUF1841 family protein [Accumulibacter sp.]MBL8393653.1 DUF1841 family protein [Accumulibacter sp.]